MISESLPSAGAGAAAAAPPDCSICLDRCNKSTRKPANCPHCAEPVCRGCIQKYLLEDQSVDNRCPSCHAVWNEEFLTASLTGVFRHGPLRDHRAKIILDTEKARLPDLQGRARAYLNAKEALVSLDKRRASWMRKWRNARKEHMEAARAHKMELDITKRPALMEAVNAAQEKFRNVDQEFLNWSHTIYNPVKRIITSFGLAGAAAPLAGAGGPATAPAPQVWRSKCPSASCAGFLDGTTYACGLCELQACKECLEPVGPEHVCNPDTIASVAAIQKDSKPCPKCATQISKISGCDQMWCTQCHTTFSWITGAVEAGVVHNPHYYQWMRETGQVIPRAAGDAPPVLCDMERVAAWFQTHKFATKSMLYNYFRIPAHLHHTSSWIERELRQLTEEERINERCVRHLAGELDNPAWEKEIADAQKRIAILRASIQFHQMCIHVMTSILAQILDIAESDIGEGCLKPIEDQMHKFLTYRRENARRLRLTYKASESAFAA